VSARLLQVFGAVGGGPGARPLLGLCRGSSFRDRRAMVPAAADGIADAQSHQLGRVGNLATPGLAMPELTMPGKRPAPAHGELVDLC